MNMPPETLCVSHRWSGMRSHAVEHENDECVYKLTAMNLRM